MSFSAVVFPAPLRPSSTSVSPRSTVKFRFRSSACPPGKR